MIRSEKRDNRALERNTKIPTPLPADLDSTLERIEQLECELAETKSAMALSGELLRNTNIEINQSLHMQERLNAELVEMDRLKTEFVANISHELRTPLNSIIGSLQMIADRLFDNEKERDTYVQDALTSAQSLLAIINDMLDVSKVDAGKLSLEVQEVPIDELFEALYEAHGPVAQRAKLSLKFEISNPGHCSVRGDRQRVKQVFDHLLSNAIKFTPEGYVKVCVDTYPGDPNTMLFSIEDTGIGIPQEYHDKVFEMFVQVDGSSRRKYDGTGLGLAICKRLVEFMGGQIWIVKHKRERGTTVSFTLPAGGCQAVQPEPAAPEQEDAGEQLSDSF